MPYDVRLPLHAPIRRPLLHPLRRRAVRRSLPRLYRYLDISDYRELLDEAAWFARPEWALDVLVGDSVRGWDLWHQRRAGIELVAWYWATQAPDWRNGNMDPTLHHVTFRDKWGAAHRAVGPARITRSDLEWKRHGVLHRVDGPAKITASGTLEWRQDGELHRTDGPAEITLRGGARWYLNGQLHRTDGPAVVSRAERAWWHKGVRHRDGAHALLTRACAQCRGAGGLACKFWYTDGRLHRADGPAAMHASGAQEWYWRGDLHRDGGPAVIRPGALPEWWTYGRPASIISVVDVAAPLHDAATLAEEFF